MSKYSVDYSKFDTIVDSDDEDTTQAAPAVQTAAGSEDVRRASALMARAQATGDAAMMEAAQGIMRNAMARNPELAATVQQHSALRRGELQQATAYNLAGNFLFRVPSELLPLEYERTSVVNHQGKLARQVTFPKQNLVYA